MMLSRYKVIDKLNTTQYLTIEEREELLDLLEQAEDKTIYYNLYVLLQARIDKAIEYIKNDWYELNTRDIEHCVNLGKDIRIDLLNILQGSEE